MQCASNRFYSLACGHQILFSELVRTWGGNDKYLLLVTHHIISQRVCVVVYVVDIFKLWRVRHEGGMKMRRKDRMRRICHSLAGSWAQTPDPLVKLMKASSLLQSWMFPLPLTESSRLLLMYHETTSLLGSTQAAYMYMSAHTKWKSQRRPNLLNYCPLMESKMPSQWLDWAKTRNTLLLQQVSIYYTSCSSIWSCGWKKRWVYLAEALTKQDLLRTELHKASILDLIWSNDHILFSSGINTRRT